MPIKQTEDITRKLNELEKIILELYNAAIEVYKERDTIENCEDAYGGIIDHNKWNRLHGALIQFGGY